MAENKNKTLPKNIDLFGLEVELPKEGVKPGRNKTGGYINNPLIPLYGVTPNEKCKTCVHLVCKSYSKNYYKCFLRGNVDKCSPVSDHKVNWPACGKWEREDVI